MDALELLEQQHREVDRLFARVEGARKSEQGAIFELIAEALRKHSFLEEEIFYPGVRRAQTEDLVGDALEDHETIERLLQDIEETGVVHQSFFTKLTALREYVQDHVKDEEQELFPRVRELLSEDELRTMGSDMQASSEEWEEEDHAETEQVEPQPQTSQEPQLDDPRG